MAGYRTIVVMLVSSVVVPYAAKHGLDLTDAQQSWLVGAAMAGIGVAMRLITKTPVFTKEPPK